MTLVHFDVWSRTVLMPLTIVLLLANTSSKLTHTRPNGHCDKCLKHFAQYQLLSKHDYEYHQLGHFQCSFPACTFTEEFRMQMFDHYRQQHKFEFVCSQTGCNYRTYIEAILKAHERAHLGIKPFRCKWANCGYSSSYQHGTLKHIRTQHSARFESSNQDVDPFTH